ncbi:MAG: hypothetical protein WC415_02505 [Patescibacteria group bacterium]|jgi:hypothetical protein
MNKKGIVESFFFYFSEEEVEITRKAKHVVGLTFKRKMCIVDGKEKEYTTKSKKLTKRKGYVGNGICGGSKPEYPPEYYVD